MTLSDPANTVASDVAGLSERQWLGFEASSRTPGSQLAKFVRVQPIGAGSVAALALLAALALFAPLFADDPLEVSLDRLQSPSAAHIFGTDNFGRDVWSRTVYGARVSLGIGIGASALATSVAVLVGLLGGYARGLVARLVETSIDVFMAFPALVFLVAAAALAPGAGIWKVVVLLGITGGMRSSRVVRSAVLTVRSAGYVEAARSVGASPLRVSLVHVLPNTFGTIMAMASLLWGFSILAEASLSFVGLGVPPPEPSWGQMIAGSRVYMELAPWTVIGPGAFLMTTVFAVNMLGDALRDILDPRLTQGRRR